MRSKVTRGQYESAGEVARQSLRKMQQDELFEHLDWSDVRRRVKDVRKGIEADDVMDGPAFMCGKIGKRKSRVMTQKHPARTGHASIC